MVGSPRRVYLASHADLLSAAVSRRYVAFPESVAEQATAGDGERYFLVPLHTGPRDWLQVPRNHAAYAKLLLLRIVVRDWAGAAALVDRLPMKDDSELVPPERKPEMYSGGACVTDAARRSYSEAVGYLKSGGKSADEMGLLLRLALRAREKDSIGDNSGLSAVYDTYVSGLDQMCAACQLSLEQELQLAQVFPEVSAVERRRAALLAVREGASAAAAANGSSSSSASASAAELMQAHRDGGSLVELFESRQARAELVRAHVALCALRPPPMPDAPIIIIDGMKEEKDPSTYGKPLTSSWQLRLECRMPPVRPLSLTALGGGGGGGSAFGRAMSGDAARNAARRGADTIADTEITGFEILVLEYKAEDAMNKDAVPLSATTEQYDCAGLAANAPAVSVLKNSMDEYDTTNELDSLTVEFRSFATRRNKDTLTGTELLAVLGLVDEPDEDHLEVGLVRSSVLRATHRWYVC